MEGSKPVASPKMTPSLSASSMTLPNPGQHKATIKSMIQRIEAMSIEAVLAKYRSRKEANTAFQIQKHEDTLHMRI